jgi:cytochrome c-type biogenesis protein CcsB
VIAEYSNLAMVSATVLYLIALVFHSLEWASARGGEVSDQPRENEERWGRLGLSVTLVAAVVHVTGVVLRGVAAQRAPWGNMYEFITSSIAMAIVIYLVGVFFFGWKGFGLPVTLLASIGVGLAVTVFYVDVAPLMPALHSVWFVIHIVAAALAGAIFNIGGIASILFLIRQRAERRAAAATGTVVTSKVAAGVGSFSYTPAPADPPGVTGYLSRLPDSATLDRVSYRMHAFAFPLWTFAVAAGAIWAQYAWGRFWGWDPKETWSLVTWIIYAAYLHARATAGWKGTRAAVLAIVGLVSFWWNFVGVNLLLNGLHSYAGI